MWNLLPMEFYEVLPYISRWLTRAATVAFAIGIAVILYKL